MKFVIPASGRTNPERFGEDALPKCLFDIGNGKTILEYQLELLSKYNIPIDLILGYKSHEVTMFCVRNGLFEYNLTTVPDYGWRDEYSLTRMIRNSPEQFSEEFIMIFSDTLFKDDLVQRLINNDYDVYKCVNTRKFSNRGTIALIKAVQENYQIKALDTPIFFKMQEIDPDLNIKFNENDPVWQFDIDNRDELNRARNLNL